jgi:aspartate/methionine/tyrosine aminotransferase
VATGLMVQPPQPGDASYATYQAERDGILASLRRRAQRLSGALNQLQGVSCNSIDGALYAFPTIMLPGGVH